MATYQSVSGAGKEPMDELFRQTRAVFVADPIEKVQFTKQIAFNVIPHIDIFLDSGFTKEEWKMMVETQKILDPDIQVSPPASASGVYRPSESLTVEFEKPITAEKARSILREAPGVLVIDKREDGGYVTPVEAAGEDATYVSRIRKDPTVEHGLSLWVVADNLRKGAALNAVQIAESLINRKLLKRRRSRQRIRAALHLSELSHVGAQPSWPHFCPDTKMRAGSPRSDILNRLGHAQLENGRRLDQRILILDQQHFGRSRLHALRKNVKDRRHRTRQRVLQRFLLKSTREKQRRQQIA